MPAPARNSRVLHFGVFEADLQEAELRKGGIRIKLQEQPFQILSMLLEHPGQTVTREELRQRLWPADTFVDFDHSLNSSIKKLREALGDDSDNPRFIETLHRRGYRFVAPVDGQDGQTTPTLRREKGFPKPTALWIAGAVIVLSAVTVWFRLPPPSPRVTHFAQITNDGRAKDGDVYQGIATDGQRLYFQEIENDHLIVSQVWVAGGDVAPISMPFADVFLLGISPDHSELLISSLFSIPHSAPLWTVPLPTGSPHRLGELAGFAATWAPDGHAIYFVSKSDLYVANSDGGSPRKLASIKGNPYFLRCSPDGRHLRFTVGSDESQSVSLWEIGTDGRGLRPLLLGWHNPPRECCGTWTTDGQYYVFQTYTHTGGGDIYALPEKTLWPGSSSRPMQLTNGPLRFFSPQPSSDGKKIFVLGLRRRSELVRYEANVGWVPYLGGISATGVAFSADGGWVTYVAQPEGTLWRSRIDGSERLQLTYPPIEVLMPRWSPDGKQIVFMGVIPNRGDTSFVISSSGGVPQEIVAGNLNSGDPGWSPDGKAVVLTLYDSGFKNQRISILDLLTKKETRLPGSELFFSPRWSPDGKHIAAIANDSDKLMLFDLARQQWSELARMWIGCPSWSHNGRYLYFDSLGPEAAFYRVRISDGKLERLVSLKGSRRLYSNVFPWSGLGPDDSLLLEHDISSEEIYALDWH